MKNFYYLVFSAVLLLCPANVSACMQRFGTKLDGEYTYAHYSGRRLIYHLTNSPSYETWTADAASLRPLAMSGSDYKEKSDLAVDLLHTGKVEEAIGILEPLSRERPDSYELTANLGTAYELGGKLDKALEYISRGIEINPQSHYGSEWLHVKILRARLAMASDPKWLETHSVLGLDFGSGPKPVLPAHLEGGARELERISQAILYQLHERLQFVKAPNPIVADLLFDLANIQALIGVVEDALPIYQFGSSFGNLRAPQTAMRTAELTKISNRLNLERILAERPIEFGVALALVSGTLLIYGHRRSKRHCAQKKATEDAIQA